MPKIKIGKGATKQSRRGGRQQELAIIHRRQEEVKLYLQGLTMHQIAERVGVSTMQVSRDLSSEIENSLSDLRKDVDELRAKELAGLNAAEARAWEEYEFSCTKQVTMKPAKGDKDQTVKVVLQRQLGSDRWFELALKCKEARCKLLNLYKSEQKTVNNNTQVNVGVDWGQMFGRSLPADDPVEAEIEKVKALPPGGPPKEV